MTRLLTEQGKQAARYDWDESCPTWSEEHHLLIAQDAKTAQLVRQEIAATIERRQEAGVEPSKILGQLLINLKREGQMPEAK